jgi:hypothetical protein
VAGARRWRATRQRALRSVGLTVCVFWAQDVSFITARPVQTAARVVSSAAAPVLPAAPSRPAVPARDAEPWSAEEDALLVQLHSGRKAPTDASAYAAIADKTGRSVNAVKVRALARLLRRLRVLAGELEPELWLLCCAVSLAERAQGKPLKRALIRGTRRLHEQLELGNTKSITAVRPAS